MDRKIAKAHFKFDITDLGASNFSPSLLEINQDVSSARVQELDKAFLEFLMGCHESSKDLLMKANRRFRSFLKEDGLSLDAQYGLALTLFELYEMNGENHFLLDSVTHFQMAEKLNSDSKNFSLFWDFAKAQAAWAEKSNEPSDYLSLFHLLEKANQAGMDPNAEIYHRMSATLLKIASLTRNKELYPKAIALDQQALSFNIASGRSWFLLGLTHLTVYENTLDEDQGKAANDAFEKAAKLEFGDDMLFMHWGKLLFKIAKLEKSSSLCAAALDKLSKLVKKDSLDGTLLQIEASSFLGLMTENYTLLQQAKQQIEALEEVADPEPTLFLTYGRILLDHAAYFESPDFYYLAIEKFQEGVSLNSAIAELWEGLGFAFTQTVLFDEEVPILAKAAQFYAKAIELSPEGSTLFAYASILRRLAEIKKDKHLLERAILHFEQAIVIQKQNLHLFTEGLFEFACALEAAASESGNETFYLRAVDLLQRLILLKPDHADYYSKIGLIQGILADLHQDIDLYHQASAFFRSAHRIAPENDLILLDWAITLMNICDLSEKSEEASKALFQAKQKLIEVAKLGNDYAYYHMGCIFAYEGKEDKAIDMLLKAIKRSALPSQEEIYEDSWLEPLHDHEIFSKIIANAKP